MCIAREVIQQNSTVMFWKCTPQTAAVSFGKLPYCLDVRTLTARSLIDRTVRRVPYSFFAPLIRFEANHCPVATG